MKFAKQLTKSLISLLVIASNLTLGFSSSSSSSGVTPSMTRGDSSYGPFSSSPPTTSIATAIPAHSPSQSPLSDPSSSSSSSSSWSSYVTIDPSKILSLLVKKVGFFLDPQLPQLATLLHCDKAQFNLVQKELRIHNFTVSLPDKTGNTQQNQPALRIGTIHVSWNSYSRPCLEIQVENVDILVEFTNLLLTRNNWNELSEMGFPPKMLYYYDDDNSREDVTTTKPATTQNEDYDVMRIASLDLTGQVVLHTRSRPLGQALAEDIVVRLDAIRELNQRVRQLSEENAMHSHQGIRRGCTSDEIYDLYRSFFLSKAKQAIRFALEDITRSKLDPSRESRLANESKRIVSSAKESLKKYADSVGSLSKEKLKQQLRVTGEDGDIILDDEQLDRLVSDGFDTFGGSVKSMAAGALRQLSGILRSVSSSSSTSSTSTADNDNQKDSHDNQNGTSATPKMMLLEDDIFFPDW